MFRLSELAEVSPIKSQGKFEMTPPWDSRELTPGEVTRRRLYQHLEDLYTQSVANLTAVQQGPVRELLE
ncbi:MAG: hypothetical protein ABW185_07165 [Sedimenticola sp.]